MNHVGFIFRSRICSDIWNYNKISSKKNEET